MTINDYNQLKKSLTPSNIKQPILAFSKRIDIDPGIVAGRIGKEMGVWGRVVSLRKKLEYV